MWKQVASIVFNVVIIIVLIAALYASVDWPRETALFPQVVGVSVLALTILSLGLELYQARKGSSGTDTGGKESDEEGTAGAAFLLKSARMYAWLLGFGAAIWVLGFYAAAFCFIFLYVRLRARDSMLAAFLWSSGTVATIIGVFELLLGVQLFRGLIWTAYV